MNATPRQLAIAVAALFVLSLTGLVTVDPAGTTVVAKAARATLRAGSAHVEVTALTRGVGESRTMSTGVIDFASGRSKLTTALPGAPAADVVSAGGVVYLRAAGPLAAFGRGKPWIGFDVNVLGEAGAAAVGGASSDPLADLRALSESGFVHGLAAEGTEDIRGAPATRYRGEVDAEKLRTLVSGPARSLLGSSGPGVAVEAPRFSAWVGGDGLLRKYEVSVSATVAQRRFEFVSSTELFDYGPALDISVPPPGDVRRITSLQELVPG